jgi:hypothetical protein
MLKAILLVVVVLVLDLLCGVNRSARVTRAARFGRSLSLPYEARFIRLNQRGEFVRKSILSYSARRLFPLALRKRRS